MHRLTVAEVRKLGPGWHCDGGGLYAFVAAPGSGSWVYRYQTRNMGLGSLAVISLAEARERARACRELRAAGLDPRVKRDSDRAAARQAAAKAMTFDQATAAYITAHGAGWRNPKHRQQWENTLKSYVSPVIGALPVGAVDVGLVLKILEPIWSVKPETAARLRGRIEAIMDSAAVRGHRSGENPARWRGHLDKLLPKLSRVRRVKHHPALEYTHLHDFMTALRARQGVAARALEFTILTAARSGEVRGATFGEFDLRAGVWTVPPERMKSGREHRVPLGPRALAIVADLMRQAREIAGGALDSRLVFPGLRLGRPLSDMSLTAVLRRMRRDDITTHGFRATFRTWAGERTNFSREVVEAALAHVVGGKVEAAYQRGDLFDKRRRLMIAWEGYARATPAGGAILPLRRRSES